MRRILVADTNALSIMYDALLFVVMVSLAGAVLLPGMVNNMAIKTSVEKHREEIVDDALLMLMTSRADQVSYTFAGTQLQGLLGGLYNISLINDTIHGLLGRHMLHKTHADLLAENMISQLMILGCRVNLFTDEYDRCLKACLTSVLTNHFAGKYQFNLSVIWRPIKGLPFGGELFIGDTCPQKNTHVARASIMLPDNSLTSWLRNAEYYIADMVDCDPVLQNISDYLMDFNETNQLIIKENITRLCTEIINAVLFDGFSISSPPQQHVGVINATIDYIFQQTTDTLQALFDASLQRLEGFFSRLDSLYLDFSAEFEEYLISMVSYLLNDTLPGGFSIEDNEMDGIDFSDFLLSLKKMVVSWAKTLMHLHLQASISSFVETMMGLIDPAITTSDEIKEMTQRFFSKTQGVPAAEMQLTIWEMRG